MRVGVFPEAQAQKYGTQDFQQSEKLTSLVLRHSLPSTSWMLLLLAINKSKLRTEWLSQEHSIYKADTMSFILSCPP